jgi:HD-GYP domain-containing protein (c-di-GMP phosphodiesterase class II)
MERVAQLSEQLARRLGFSESEVKMIRMGASLHDIGRIGVGEEILSIPGKLSPQEWDVVRRHPIIGDEIIAPLRVLAEARHIVRHHHERLDGGGYPDGLSGEQVTPALQVVSLADSYDALTSPRPWRPAIPREEALAMLEEERGSRFDPQIMDTFAEMMREE